MSTTIKQATQQDSESIIFGSGFDIFSWWRGLSRDWAYDKENYQAPDGWSWVVKVENPDAPGTLTKTITHSVVMSAMHRISRGEGGKYVNDETRAECHNVIFKLDEADLDAVSADQVMQVAMFGRIVYG